MTYRERRERKAERLREWAAKRQERATATLEADRATYGGDVAFNTQPGHIVERARVITRTDRAIESLNKAQRMESRAGNIEAQLDSSIYSDDPDAIERLEERISSLEAERDRIKAYNAACRKGDVERVRAYIDILDDRQREHLTSHQRFYGAGNGSFPSYALSNLNGNIKRNRDRLVALRSKAS